MHQVYLILLEGFGLFDFAAASQTFEAANAAAGTRWQVPLYEVQTFASRTARTARSDGGVALQARPLPRSVGQRIHTVIVFGGSVSQVLHDPSGHTLQVSNWLAHHRPRIERLAAVGSQAFMAIHASNARSPRSASVPGQVSDSASSRSPTRTTSRPPASSSARMPSRTQEVERLWQATGAFTGMQLALRMVEQDFGFALAVRVSAQILPDAEPAPRPLRFRSALHDNTLGDERVLKLHRWIEQNLDQHLVVEILAQKMFMTPRTFARIYRRATGFTPARAVEQLRMDAARHLAETTLLSFKAIAARCGFSSEEVMRRAFQRTVKVPPSKYRSYFFTEEDPERRSD